MEQIKVGDTVRTRRGYLGVVKHIYSDDRVILDVGEGRIYGCCIQAVTKVKKERK